MNKEIKRILANVSTRITPTEEERSKVENTAKELEQRVSIACRNHNIDAIVRVEGSVAKDTWLREEPDVDIFMRLPTTIARETLGNISLRIAREATKGSKHIERFAEHPYLETFVDGIRVNIVPCYETRSGDWVSATDRTPFHTDYVKARLSRDLRREVRLAKKLFKALGIYGAEIKIGGFSGYLCELLILNYGSLVETLIAFSRNSQQIAIDIEGHYSKEESKLKHLFHDHFIVIDPVDNKRNVASAVQPTKFDTLVGASRAFLKKPSIDFFYPSKVKAMSIETLARNLENRGSAIVFLIPSQILAVPDVLWGQLYRTQRSLKKLIELNFFKILRNEVWSDERELTVFIFELEQHLIPDIRRHIGPPLEKEEACEDFLSKYINNEEVISGPYIDKGRWIVELKRKSTDFIEFLKEKLREGGEKEGVAQLISQGFRESLTILLNNEISEIYQKNPEFAIFLTEFLSGRPQWLETAYA